MYKKDLLEKPVAIEIKDIRKEFVLPKNKNSTLKQAAINIIKRDQKTIYKVLDGISFNINKGDFFGIVGKNGSGKSTLLKLIAGVYEPTAGNIYVHGGLTPFIELGVGFNPELSGRDNVYLNGALLGFTRKQMDKMYDNIVDFAELGPFMDQKLKNYSSGMQVRLAFSIAIKAKNDILIFDEVLAVGDEAFQRKCLNVFEEYKKDGQTVVLVSHDMSTIKKFCNRVALIDKGKVTMIGKPIEVSDEYTRLNNLVVEENIKEENKTVNSDLIQTKLTNNGVECRSFGVNETANLEITWHRNIEVDRVLLDLYKLSGDHVCNFITSREGIKTLAGRNKVNVDIKLNLAPGVYFFTVGLWEKNFKKKIASSSHTSEFVISKDWSRAEHEFDGTTLLEHSWH